MRESEIESLGAHGMLPYWWSYSYKLGTWSCWTHGWPMKLAAMHDTL